MDQDKALYRKQIFPQNKLQEALYYCLPKFYLGH